jgi:hypothetical protein
MHSAAAPVPARKIMRFFGAQAQRHWLNTGTISFFSDSDPYNNILTPYFSKCASDCFPTRVPEPVRQRKKIFNIKT